MRVLTVKQPWAWAIIHGGKDVENRVRNLAGDYRGPVAIHAGLGFDQSADDSDQSWEIRRAITAEDQGYPADDSQVWGADTIEETDPRYVRGAIIGVVDLVGVHNSISNGQTPMCWGPGERMTDRGPGFCSPWATRAEKHLEMSSPRALTEPIPWKGALGLRTLPESVIEQIRSASALS